MVVYVIEELYEIEIRGGKAGPVPSTPLTEIFLMVEPFVIRVGRLFVYVILVTNPFFSSIKETILFPE